ncbi:MAG: hypothetical protein JWR07_2059 [Nevskia sp.]|nr:hypothetical protein [Nevskia sp.]
MNHSPLLVLHICAASLGLLTGAMALFSRKGARLHRKLGNVFFVSMLFMSASGAYLALMKSVMLSVVVGVLTFYLVATAWLTVVRKEGETGFVEIGALLVALAAGTSGLIFGWEGAHSASGLKDGFPAGAYFGFGSVALFAATLDVRMLIRGGVSGVQRIARHLWRMCFALLIGATSLFNGQEKIFPEVLRGTWILNVPAAVIVLAMIYWLIRVLFTKAYKKPVDRQRPVRLTWTSRIEESHWRPGSLTGDRPSVTRSTGE